MRSYKRIEAARSVVTLLAGLVVIGAIYTSVGPPPRVRLVFLVVLRLHRVFSGVVEERFFAR